MNSTTKRKQRTRRAPRITAMAISLLLSISAVACARQDLPDNGPSHTESTCNQPASLTQLTIHNRLSAEHPAAPADQPTTLELIKEIPLGENGLPYYLMYDGDPTHATIMPAEDFLVDENGTFYSYDSMLGLHNLSTGKQLPFDNDACMLLTIPAQDGAFYALTFQGEVVRFTPEHGIEQTYSHSNPTSSQSICGNLFSYYTGQVFLQTANGIYDLDGTAVTNLPFSVEKAVDESYLLKIGDRTVAQGPYFEILLATQDGILVRQSAIRYTPNGNQQFEYLIQTYDYQGNCTLAYKMTETCSGTELPCDLSDADGIGCRWYHPRTLTIGTDTFENALYSDFFFAADGTQYYVVISVDRAQIYRIQPGCSAVQFSTGVTRRVSAAPVYAASATEEQQSNHITLTRAEVLARAQEIVNFQWTVKDQHKQLKDKTKLPTQVDNAQADDILTGIPYCWGGFNGLEDTIEYTENGIKTWYSFENSLSGNYMAGNTHCEGGHKTGTIGLDCSGFVCTCYKIAPKIYSGKLTSFGHEIDISQAKSMDFFVKGGEHTLLFSSYANPNQMLYYVYESTIDSERTNMQGTVYRWIYASKVADYSLRTPFFDETWSSNSTQHWHGCSFCSEQKNVGNHIWRDNPSGGTYCRICNYFTGITITPTGSVLPAAITAPESKPFGG